jgi:CarD family transcriptional regulator
LFNIGDKVVCPKQGVGIIENIEERQFLGETQKYFIIKLLSHDMTILIPLNKIDNFKLRPISDGSAVEDALTTLKENRDNLSLNSNFKERYNENLDKLATGSLNKCSEVVRDLSIIKKIKALNSSEQVQLNNARQLLTDEISLIRNVSKNQVSMLLDTILS